MERLNNVQRSMIIAALKKEQEGEEKVYRQMADADLFDVYAKTGAKTFDVPLENEDRKVSIGTASVVAKEGGYEVVDFDDFRWGAEDAGLIDYTFRVATGHVDEVMGALKDAGLDGLVSWEARPVKDWQKECAEDNGRLIFRETGEAVLGVAYVPGKTYTMLNPKSAAFIKEAARALYGSTPMALLEGGQDAERYRVSQGAGAPA